MSFDSKELRRKPLGQEVTWRLKRMIIRGELKPGERLVEEKLAGLIGISRTPVREALHRLEQEGLITKRDRGGYLVRPLMPEEVEDAVGVRAALEAYAAELAAKQQDRGCLVLMTDNLGQFDQALADRDNTRLVALNTKFHALLHQAAGSPLVLRLLGDLGDIVERISRAAISTMEAAQWSSDEHRGIVEAIKAGDSATAGRITRDHVVHGGTWIVGRMKSEQLEL